MPEFFDNLLKPYEKPEGYRFVKCSPEDLEHALHTRKMVISGVQNMEKHGDNVGLLSRRWDLGKCHSSHTISYDLLFWDKVITWILIPCFIPLPDIYEFKNNKIDMFDLLFGALDRNNDRYRLDLLKSLMMVKIRNFEKGFSFKEFCRSYHILLLFSSHISQFYYSEKSKYYRLVKLAKKEREKKENSKKRILERLIKKFIGRERIFFIFHSIMIEKNRKYDDLDCQYQTLLEISDDVIMFPFEDKDREISRNNRVDFDRVSIFTEFGERFMGYCGLECEECREVETVFKFHKKCAGCKKVRYCSTDCQKKNWKKHRPKCLELRKDLEKKINRSRK